MECKRWRRYGKDRLYIHDAGNQLGWWDLETDEAHVVVEGSLPKLAAAVQMWRQSVASDNTMPPSPMTLVGSQTVDSTVAANTQVVTTEQVVVEIQLQPEPRGPAFMAPDAPPLEAYGVVSPAEVPACPAEPSPPEADLLLNSPGLQLMGQIQTARAAGQRPTLLRRIFLGKHAYSSWERGAIGEQLVAAELARLNSQDPRWGAIHSIPVGENGSDIDHLVIGPGGIFTLNTKHHKGCKVWVGGDTYIVNGVRLPFVRNSRSEARRAARLLRKATGWDLPVTGVVVPVNARHFVVKRGLLHE